MNSKTEGSHESSLRERLERAAAALEAGSSLEGLEGMLTYLGYNDVCAAEADGRARMLRAASKLRRIFQIPVPDAPGLVFFGGEADPSLIDGSLPGLAVGSLAGSGLSPKRAFESCVGEGVEYLSQFIHVDDRLEMATRRALDDQHANNFITAILASSGRADTHPIAWAPVRKLTDNAKTWFPADLCFRRAPSQQDFVAPLKLSTGCAAGQTKDAATLRAMLELIERDAVALWWRGGRRPRPVAQESDAGRASAELWQCLRQGLDQRRQWLLDITTDLGIPAVAAISANHDGFGFAFGFGARMTLADAACAAIFELCQVELGQHVIAAKQQESGQKALNDSDRRQLRRATLFDTTNCALLEPEGLPAHEAHDGPSEVVAALHFLVDRLHHAGISSYTLDLTRTDFGIPVVRVLAPGLQLEPSQIASERLASTISETGGGGVYTGGMPLL